VPGPEPEPEPTYQPLIRTASSTARRHRKRLLPVKFAAAATETRKGNGKMIEVLLTHPKIQATKQIGFALAKPG